MSGGVTATVKFEITWSSPNTWPAPVSAPPPQNWPVSTQSGFDVIYFLDCRHKSGSRWRSAVMRFKQANLATLNQGQVPQDRVDEFCWVTEDSRRQYPGFMYDVSFDARKSDAGHFRSMIYPGAEKYNENVLCGWIAKVEPYCERSRMIPVYRADTYCMMIIGDYECIRIYYATWAPPPANLFRERCATNSFLPGTYIGRDQPMPPSMPHMAPRHMRRMITTASGDAAQTPESKDVDVGDMAEDVEAARSIGGGQVKEAAQDLNQISFEQPSLPIYTIGSDQDPDTFKGEQVDEVALYEAEEH